MKKLEIKERYEIGKDGKFKWYSVYGKEIHDMNEVEYVSDGDMNTEDMYRYKMAKGYES